MCARLSSAHVGRRGMTRSPRLCSIARDRIRAASGRSVKGAQQADAREGAMIEESQTQYRLRHFSAAAATALAMCVLAGTSVRAAEPITIGFGMALTGGLPPPRQTRV